MFPRKLWLSSVPSCPSHPHCLLPRLFAELQDAEKIRGAEFAAEFANDPDALLLPVRDVLLDEVGVWSLRILKSLCKSLRMKAGGLRRDQLAEILSVARDDRLSEVEAMRLSFEEEQPAEKETPTDDDVTDPTAEEDTGEETAAAKKAAAEKLDASSAKKAAVEKRALEAKRAAIAKRVLELQKEALVDEEKLAESKRLATVAAASAAARLRASKKQEALVDREAMKLFKEWQATRAATEAAKPPTPLGDVGVPPPPAHKGATPPRQGWRLRGSPGPGSRLVRLRLRHRLRAPLPRAQASPGARPGHQRRRSSSPSYGGSGARRGPTGKPRLRG